MNENSLKNIDNIVGIRIEKGIVEFNEFISQAIPRNISKSKYYKKFTMVDYLRILFSIIVIFYFLYEIFRRGVKFDLLNIVSVFFILYIVLTNFYAYLYTLKWNKVLRYGKIEQGVVKKCTFKLKNKLYILQVDYQYRNSKIKKYLFDIPTCFEKEFRKYLNGEEKKIDLLAYNKTVAVPLLLILASCYEVRGKELC